MSKKKNFIIVNRSLQKHWLWKDESFSNGQAWVDLLLSANHAEGKFRKKGQLVKVQRGQTAQSELTLAEKWKWSRGKVRRFLKTLSDEGMIVQQTNHLTSIVTICNYSDYQDFGTTNETASSTTDNTPLETPSDTQTTITKQET